MKEVRYKRDLCNSKEDITKMAEFISVVKGLKRERRLNPKGT